MVSMEKNIEIEDLNLTILFKTNISYLRKRKMVGIWALLHKRMGTMVESWRLSRCLRWFDVASAFEVRFASLQVPFGLINSPLN